MAVSTRNEYAIYLSSSRLLLPIGCKLFFWLLETVPLAFTAAVKSSASAGVVACGRYAVSGRSTADPVCWTLL